MMSLRAKHLASDVRRAVTVEAVIELAAEQNPSEITTAAIAERMNVTQGALFRHFVNKEAVWTAVMEWVTGQLLVKVDRADKGIESPLAALEAVFLTHIDFIAKRPGIPRILFCELQRNGDTAAKQLVRTLIKRYGERLRTIIERGRLQGEIDPEVNAAAAAAMLIGAIQGLVIQSLLAGDVRRIRKDAPAAFAFFRRTLRRVK